jgi:hypothetical protein
MAKHVEIHSFDESGVERRLCALTGDNAAVLSASALDQPRERAHLMETAARAAETWQRAIGPSRSVRVVEVDDPRVWTSETPYREPRRGNVTRLQAAQATGTFVPRGKRVGVSTMTGMLRA